MDVRTELQFKTMDENLKITLWNFLIEHALKADRASDHKNGLVLRAGVPGSGAVVLGQPHLSEPMVNHGSSVSLPKKMRKSVSEKAKSSANQKKLNEDLEPVLTFQY